MELIIPEKLVFNMRKMSFNKQIIKMPKLYFKDLGLLCSVLGIDAPDKITYHYLKGGIFENLVVSEFTKFYMNTGRHPPFISGRIKEVEQIKRQSTKLTFVN